MSSRLLVERARLPLFALAYTELRYYEDERDAVAAALLRICRHVTRSGYKGKASRRRRKAQRKRTLKGGSRF